MNSTQASTPSLLAPETLRMPESEPEWATPGHRSVIQRPPGEGASSTEWVDWSNGVPQVRAMGMTCLSCDPEQAVFGLVAAPFPQNADGAINGGMVASAIDQSLGVLAARAAAPGTMPVTGTLHVQYHSAALPPLTVTARLLPGGKRTVFAEVVVQDREGRRCATGNGTMVMVRPRTAASSTDG